MGNEFVKKVLSLVKKEYGEGIGVSGEKFLSVPRKVLPISPAINIGLGGGIPEGSWVIFAGKAKCGKTTSALHAAAKWQRPEYGSRHVYYFNVEGRIKEMNLKGVRGLDLSEDMFTMIQSTEEKILTAKDFLNILEAAVMNHPKCTCIVDSFSALTPEKEQTEGVGTSTRGGVGALMGQLCRQLGQILPLKRSVILGITQLYSNTSGYGSPIAEKGGLSIQYQGDVKLRCKSTEDWLSSGKKIGQKVIWTAEYTATGAPPGSEIESWLRYGIGIDDIFEASQLAADLGLIEQSGAWYLFKYLKDYPTLVGNWNEEVEKKCKAHGKDNVYSLLAKNPTWLDALQVELAKLTGATNAV